MLKLMERKHMVHGQIMIIMLAVRTLQQEEVKMVRKLR